MFNHRQLIILVYSIFSTLLPIELLLKHADIGCGTSCRKKIIGYYNREIKAVGNTEILHLKTI